MKYYSRLEKDYSNSTDLIIKIINGIYLIYLESLSSQDKINDYILKSLSNCNKKLLKNYIPSPNVIDIKNYKQLTDLLNIGFCIVINNNECFAVEVKSDLTRSISNPSMEATIFGPKDSLSENIQINLGLIKRRIKSSNLKNIDINIGKYTNTKCSVLYIDSIAKYKYVKNIIINLKRINVDGIKDIGELKKYLLNDNKNVFPSIKITERPDVITSSLLNGKIIIILDTSPYALILPTFFADLINPITDDYSKSININFNKIMRLICFFISILLPGIYIAISTINHETIPTTLLTNFMEQRLKVPYPTYIECLVTLIVVEILKESDIRFPSSYGSAISILGALILGEAAVSAGIVSPIMIIIIAFSFISSMIFSDNDMAYGIRYHRILCLIICSIFGLYGSMFYFIFLISYLSSKEYDGIPYFYPISPFDYTYLKSSILSIRNNKRSSVLSNNRIKEDS